MKPLVQVLTPEEIIIIKKMICSPSLDASVDVCSNNRNTVFCWITKSYLIKSELLSESDNVSPSDIFGFAIKDLDFVKTQNSYLIYSVDNKQKKFALDKIEKAITYFIKQM